MSFFKKLFGSNPAQEQIPVTVSKDLWSLIVTWKVLRSIWGKVVADLEKESWTPVPINLQEAFSTFQENLEDGQKITVHLCLEKPTTKPIYCHFPASEFASIFTTGLLEIARRRDHHFSLIKDMKKGVSETKDREYFERNKRMGLHYADIIDKIGLPIKALLDIQKNDNDKFQNFWVYCTFSS